ncbi:site-specific integrase [Maribacter sp. Asnod1-A12]|uniref:site-specific integrase n=1 Tax=Maribacter sp. Asnod1-A12 TaxID=3160576 RepID=UPI0038672511
MNEKFEKFNSLTHDASNYMRHKLKFSESGIYKYNLIWKKVRKYIIDNNHEELNQEVGDLFIAHFFNDKVYDPRSKYTQNYIRIIKYLIEYKENSRMTLRKGLGNKLPKFEGAIGEIIIDFINKLHREKLSIGNIRTHSRHLFNFQQLCKQHNLNSPEKIDFQFITIYLNQIEKTSHSTTATITSIIRKFTSYLFEMNIIKKNISKRIPSVKKIKGEKLLSTYSEKEVLKILKTINRSTAIGKRNYAITLILVKYGLRASDVAKLSLDEILWEKQLISFNQNKTLENLTLPLTSDVGNAIIDYLKFGRPQCDSRSIFITNTPPYSNTMTNSGIYQIISGLIRTSGVKVNNRKIGPHALRHSLASRMFEKSTPLHTITQVLGHKSLESKKAYMHIDLKSMQKCILNVSPVNKNFYEQGGGKFYE